MALRALVQWFRSFRDRRVRRAVRRAIEQQSRARDLTAVRNVLDAQARPRCAPRNAAASKLGLQAAYLATAAMRGRDFCSRLARLNEDCRRHAEKGNQEVSGADGDKVLPKLGIKMR